MRAVLAHELAHVARGDYVASLAAQCVRALHFYNPLVYWLAARLRLEQELAADAVATEHAGGRKQYLASLASLALATDARAVPWPARPFLPGRGTLLRRIDMLRHEKLGTRTGRTRNLRFATIAALLAVAIIAAGIRGPRDQSAASASAGGADNEQVAERAESTELDLTYVPADADMVLAFRVQSDGGENPFAAISETLLSQFGSALDPGQVEQVANAIWTSSGEGQRHEIAILRSRAGVDWHREFAAKGLPEVDFRDGEKTFRAYAIRSTSTRLAFVLNSRTLLILEKSGLIAHADRTPIGAVEPSWSRVWRQLESPWGAIYLSGKMMKRQGGPGKIIGLPEPWAEAAAAVADGLYWGVAGVQGNGQQPGINIHLAYDSAESATRAAETTEALITLIRNNAGGIAEKMSAAMPSNLWLAPLLEMSVEVAQVDQRESDVVLSARLPEDAFAVELQRATTAASDAAIRMQSMNNMKMIALALHNYASAHGHFPPVATYDEDGKPLLSWRVLILPYLETGGKELYQQFRLDEPWDSPHNKKLIDKMPAEYRFPSQPDETTSAAYFGIAGPETVFPPDHGVPFREITDGTSNTIMLVEAKRDIPWTKPEDIPYDSMGEMPRLGGYQKDGFNTAFADGSVHFVSEAVEPEVLQKLITIAGKEVIQLPF